MQTHPDFVRDAIVRSGISKADLAKRAGVNKNSLTKADRADWNPLWDTLKKVCEAAAAIKRERA